MSSSNVPTRRDPGVREHTGRRATGPALLGLGLAAVGRPAYITPDRGADLPGDRSPAALEARTHELLDAADGLHISYVDTARSYGRAEQFLSTWLRDHPDAPFVASKWGYEYVGGWNIDAPEHEVKDHTLPTFERQLTETTKLLTPWLRLYQVHSLTLDSPLWGDQALLNRLAELREQGIQLGFSTSGPAQAQAVRQGLELTVDGAPLFTSVQSTWNLMEPSAGEALADAHARGTRVVIKEALANGRLTDRGVAPGSQLDRVARRHEVGIDAIALAAALTQPWCDVVLSGAATVSQLRSNAAARDVVGVVDVGEIMAPEPPQQYWPRRSGLTWQ